MLLPLHIFKTISFTFQERAKECERSKLTQIVRKTINVRTHTNIIVKRIKPPILEWYSVFFFIWTLLKIDRWYRLCDNNLLSKLNIISLKQYAFCSENSCTHISVRNWIHSSINRKQWKCFNYICNRIPFSMLIKSNRTQNANGNLFWPLKLHANVKIDFQQCTTSSLRTVLAKKPFCIECNVRSTVHIVWVLDLKCSFVFNSNSGGFARHQLPIYFDNNLKWDFIEIQWKQNTL